MSTHIEKINDTLDSLAGRAKGGAERITDKIVDVANDVAHAAAEKAREGAEKAGEKLMDVGEKITKLAK